ncbi:precorrin-6A reductase [Ruminiclostridium hungatei]|uniref:Precorrin-6A reductase n=1 Tax=Ruminiclostridium hungatei TaxID=48256 RepID=A0A1V4SQL3_RUMHU|nr:precorrin-6A reductase [Ruminiclostridium hungatei]OPX45735.1 precorrin-6A reductase [Ruminiclostridium hungatei]
MGEDTDMAVKVLVFAGTTEGREISEFLSANGAVVTVCVATEYGRMVMPHRGQIEVRVGRMTRPQMEEAAGDYSFVIDATHPYAAIVSENIRAACRNLDMEYIRLLRPSTDIGEVIAVNSVCEAAEMLDTAEGNILVTTGSKELEKFTAVRDFDKRLYVRVLPAPEVLEKCTALGFKGKNLICMQGPFSHEMNLATLRHVNAKYMVTKDTGKAGGYEEKISAARAAGATVILIARPGDSDGLTVEELKRELLLRLKGESFNQ